MGAPLCLTYLHFPNGYQQLGSHASPRVLRLLKPTKQCTTLIPMAWLPTQFILGDGFKLHAQSSLGASHMENAQKIVFDYVAEMYASEH